MAIIHQVELQRLRNIILFYKHAQRLMGVGSLKIWVGGGRCLIPTTKLTSTRV